VRRAAIALVAVAALPGCGGSGGDKSQDGLHSPDGLMIRDWLRSVEHGDYGRAATFFAPGAIIDQGRPIRLPNAAAARFFNKTLPCFADLTALRDEGSSKVLATFHLRPGPGGPCDGSVRVRYTIKDGKFTEWRQLPNPRDEPDPTVTGPTV
jgi:hypothetical protein